MAGLNTIRAMGAGLFMAACEQGEVPASVDTNAKPVEVPTEELRLELTACLSREDGQIDFADRLITPDETLKVILGPQGGCHVWGQWHLQGNIDFRDNVGDRSLPIHAAIVSEGDLNVVAGDPTEERYPPWTYLSEMEAVSAGFMMFVMDGADYAHTAYCVEQFTEKKGPYTLSVASSDIRVKNPEPIQDIYLELNQSE